MGKYDMPIPSIELSITETYKMITKFHEEEDEFIVERLTEYANGVTELIATMEIPKSVIRRALECFRTEHEEEWKFLMGIKEN